MVLMGRKIILAQGSKFVETVLDNRQEENRKKPFYYGKVPGGGVPGGASSPKSSQREILHLLKIWYYTVIEKALLYALAWSIPILLHRFKFLGSPHCICGMLGDADHYIFSCFFTKDFYLSKPADEHKKVWFNNLLTNRQAVTKMDGAFRNSRSTCDTLTQERDHH
ncbi:hypothetical protein AVEN_266132-1 [Araneus ventricosus]|uniref:Uncharacterized protein n=1 Tax=Araneus ventricosus TaxID=182803 RepID=A0A4Y2GB23_ARAVE|nr:hypothetical protein AVEN_266132-1 [Araneus ventricosus]